MVPIRWVLSKAFRKNAEGLAGFSQTDYGGNRIMNAKKNFQNPITLAVLLGLTLLGLTMTGCGSDSPTALLETPAIVLDTAPPAVPTGLSAALDNSHVKVGWQPNTTDEDFAGFMLYRVAFGQAWPMFNSPWSGTNYVDTSPLNVSCSYAVTAFDLSGNESAWLEIPFEITPAKPALNRD